MFPELMEQVAQMAVPKGGMWTIMKRTLRTRLKDVINVSRFDKTLQ
jgi:hypothetical protein